MKKLFLSLMLVVASFAVMAQENLNPKEMVRDDYHLCFVQNNEAIPDVELQQLLGEDAFGSYCSSRKLYRVGNGLKNGGWAAFGGGLGMMATGTGLMIGANETGSSGMKNAGLLVLSVGMIAFINGNILIPTGYALRGVGSGKISRIAEAYNQADISQVSFRITPSITPVNTPQSQGNMAYGLTFSVNF
jgi:hypothetical protein